MIRNIYTKTLDSGPITPVSARKEKEKALSWRNTLMEHQKHLDKALSQCISEDEYRLTAMELDCLEHVIQLDDFYDFCTDYMCEHGIDTVVDIGCAYGHQSEAFLEENLGYIGIESSGDSPKWNIDKCMYLTEKYPCKIPDGCRFAVSNMCFEYFINDYEALAHDFDTVILNGLGKNTKVFELFDVEEIHYRPLIDGNRIWNLFILTNKHIGD